MTVIPEDSLDDYTWDELAQIADMIADSENDDGALAVAAEYGLCDSDGIIDGRRSKTFELADGSQAAVQVAGFYHDVRSDGYGRAGITFIFKNAVEKHPMVRHWSSRGGWDRSTLRSWLDKTFMAQLPRDLSGNIVAVEKLTNNVGKAKDAGAVTATSDKLWVFSLAELCGRIDWDYDGDKNAARWNSIYNAEGEQYRLFKDYKARSDRDNVILMKGFENKACWWWERTPDLTDYNRFLSVNAMGVPYFGVVGVDASAVVPGFCL